MYLSGASPQFGPEGAQLVVRTKSPPETLASTVMSTLRQINPGQPATEFRPVQRLVDHVVSPRRFFVLLVGVFAGLGLILASLGIYGVISTRSPSAHRRLAFAWRSAQARRGCSWQ